MEPESESKMGPKLTPKSLLRFRGLFHFRGYPLDVSSVLFWRCWGPPACLLGGPECLLDTLSVPCACLRVASGCRLHPFSSFQLHVQLPVVRTRSALELDERKGSAPRTAPSRPPLAASRSHAFSSISLSIPVSSQNQGRAKRGRRF